MGVEERGIRTREVATKGKTSVRWEAREAQRGNLLPAVFAGFEFPHMAHLLCTRQRRLSTSLFHSSRLSSSASLLCFASLQVFRGSDTPKSTGSMWCTLSSLTAQLIVAHSFAEANPVW